MAVAQLQYNGVTFGVPGLEIVEIEGLWESPEIRSSDRDRARAPGMWPGVDLPGARAITATIQPLADLDDPMWDDVRRALVPNGPEQPLLIQVSGIAGGRTLLTQARVRRFATTIDAERYQFGAAQIVVEWWATDPRLYDANETTKTVPLKVFADLGLEFDAEFDLEFGGRGTGSGVLVANNQGNYPAPWVCTVTGPASNLRIIDDGGGGSIKTVGTVPAGNELRIDSRNRTIELNGVSRYSWLLPGSQWFDLAPGHNELRLSAQTGAGSGSVSFRSAWL